MSIMILNEIVVEAEISTNENIFSIRETANDWMSFCLNEYELFKTYDQYLLTLTCIIACLKNNKMEKSFDNLVNFINTLDHNLIQECMDKISINLNNEETVNGDITENFECSDFYSSTFESSNISIESNYELMKGEKMYIGNVAQMRTPFLDITNYSQNGLLNRKRIRLVKNIDKKRKISQIIKAKVNKNDINL